VAGFLCSALLRHRDGTLIAGKRAYLQTSKNGKTK